MLSLGIPLDAVCGETIKFNNSGNCDCARYDCDGSFGRLASSSDS